MGSLVTEQNLFNLPNAFALGPSPNESKFPIGTYVTCNVTGNLNLTGTFNGAVISGAPVSVNATQTLQNKSFIDTNNFFVDATDATKKVAFDAAGSAATTATLRFTQTANRIYTVPDVGGDAEVILGAGAQSVGGAKTFGVAVTITPVTDQIVLGATRTVTINAPTPAGASRTHRIPDVGADADFVMTQGAQTLSGAKQLNSALTINNVNTTWLTLNTAAGGAFTFTFPNAAGAHSVAVPNALTLAALDIAQTFTTTQIFQTTLSLNDVRHMTPLSQLITNDATTTTIHTFATTTGRAYYMTAVLAAGATTDAAVFKQSVMIKNIAGTVTISTAFDSYAVADASLSTASIAWSVSGTDALLRVTGVAATNITWNGNIDYTFGPV